MTEKIIRPTNRATIRFFPRVAIRPQTARARAAQSARMRAGLGKGALASSDGKNRRMTTIMAGRKVTDRKKAKNTLMAVNRLHNG